MKIALLGDLAFYGKYSIENNSRVFDYFKEVSIFLKQYDHVIGNLETPFTESKKTYGAKSAYIKSNPENVELLKYLYIDTVNLSNNHMYDFGLSGYVSTKEILEESNIKYFGIEDKIVLLKSHFITIALHGYCSYSTNPLGIYKKKYGINQVNIPDIEEKLNEFNALGYNNIISIHSGQEHVNYPNVNDIEMARKFSSIAPYVYYGHHPHVIQGLEEKNDSLIAYSLGNFCFDDVYTSSSNKPIIKQSKNNKTSFILELEYNKNGLENYKIVPIYAVDESLRVNHGSAASDIKIYSSKLDNNKEKYTEERNKVIRKYINGRKKTRKYKWYIKRIRPKYALMIYMALYNKYKDKVNVINYLD
jgi:poly-gamma-glutamate synthesis protein (capsule biosynthesis protein)